MTWQEPANIARKSLATLKGRVKRQASARPDGRAIEADVDVAPLIQAVAKELKRPVRCMPELRVPGIDAIPDLTVVDDTGGTLGWIELKAPGKGSDPETYTGHDAEQWEQFRTLENIVYTDSEEWTLFSQGDSVLQASDAESLASLLAHFLAAEPQQQTDVGRLAESLADACRRIRQGAIRSLRRRNGSVLAPLAASWRKLLFPDLSDEGFADAYAQTVTFALVAGRAAGAEYPSSQRELIRDTATVPVQRAVEALASGSGAAGDRLLSQALNNLCSKEALDATGDGVRQVVELLSYTDPKLLSQAGDWLYFYESFLTKYDPRLRQKSGSYYTPPPLVEFMASFVEAVLGEHFDKDRGFADESVTVIDPASGTGAFLIAVIEKIAATTSDLDGPGAVADAVATAVDRLHGLEIQAAPYAVAQFRTAAACARHGADASPSVLLADTLDDPYKPTAEFTLPTFNEIPAQRRAANKLKADAPVMVAIGNPPYRRSTPEEAGGWVASVLMDAWRLEAGDQAGRHAQNLANLLVYFWRWATWKVLENSPKPGTTESDRASDQRTHESGVVCFVTTSAWLHGQGFTQMRKWLRERCSHVWVLDLSPEGFQPDTATRIFPEVQHEISVVTAARAPGTTTTTPARVWHRRVEPGRSEDKFAELARLSENPGLTNADEGEWASCGYGWTEPFAPTGTDEWNHAPKLADLVPWGTSGVTANRTWPISPDPDILTWRWNQLIQAKSEDDKGELLKKTRDRDVDTTFEEPLRPRNSVDKRAREATPLNEDTGARPDVVRYALRSFDRQWIIADRRLLDRPRPPLWYGGSDQQIHLTFPAAETPVAGPSVTFCAELPDLHHYSGRGGRAHPLWRNPESDDANLVPGLVEFLHAQYGYEVAAADVFAYIAALCAHPAFTDWRRCQAPHSHDPRVPLTAEAQLWEQAVWLGRSVIWAHTLGQRFVDKQLGRAGGPHPRVRQGPRVQDAVPQDAARHPTTITYDPDNSEILIGLEPNQGRIANVDQSVWNYRVSRMKPIESWFKYRKKDPTVNRSSDLNETTTQGWRPEWTIELLDVCHVLTALVRLEPAQKELFERIAASPQITETDLTHEGVLPPPHRARKPPMPPRTDPSLFRV